MQEMEKTQIQSLGQEDPLEKELPTYSSILAWEFPWTERSLVGYSPRVTQGVRPDWAHIQHESRSGDLRPYEQGHNPMKLSFKKQKCEF